tara:strand:- start:607 stop:870 length:264 start_codon:yes stop_codon:yes gene_type:complete
MSDEDHKNLKEKMELKDALEIKSVRDVLWRLIEKGSFFENLGVMTGDQANYANGKRDIVLGLIQEIEYANSAAWIEMQNDSLEEGEN